MNTYSSTSGISGASADTTLFKNETTTDSISTLITSGVTTAPITIPPSSPQTALTTTARVPALPVSAVYEVNQIINQSSTGFNLSDPQGQKNFFEWLREILKPELIDLVYNPQNCSSNNCSISYSVSYRGYGDPNPERITEYIGKRTSSFASTTNVGNTTSN
jgi:hypothetical protein